jgi:hypothetical protein
MGAQRTTFEKLQRDRAKKEKAALKRANRMGKGNPAETDVAEGAVATEAAPSDDSKPLSAAELLKAIEDLHARFEAKKIDFDQFEEEKLSLMARLPID